MKATIVAFSAAALLAGSSGVLAQNVPSKTPVQHHQVSKKHKGISRNAPGHAMHAKGLKTGYPSAFGYHAPSEPKDPALEASRQAGGGGGGSGGSGM